MHVSRRMKVLSVSGLGLILLAGGCSLLYHGANKPASASNVGAPFPPGTMRARMDPAHLPHVGGSYYPRESLELREQGRCDVSVTVEPDGTISEKHIVGSTTHSARLDRACLAAFAPDVRMLPAMAGGQPTQATLVIPVMWCLIPRVAMPDGTACNAPPPAR